MVEWSPRYLVGLDNEVLAGQLEDALELLSRSVESVYSRRLSVLPVGFANASKGVSCDHMKAIKALSTLRSYLGAILDCKE